MPAGTDLFVGLSSVEPGTLSSGMLGDGFHIYIPLSQLDPAWITAQGQF